MKKLIKKTDDNIESRSFATVKSRAAVAMTAIYCTLVTALPGFAAGGNAGGTTGGAIEEGIKTGAQSIWTILRAVVLPLAAVALAICAVKILWGGQRAAEEAKGTAIKIVIAVALVLLAPALVNVIGGWFAKQSKWEFNTSFS